MIGLGEYIMKELGDDVYDELEIDPSDYDSLPAYDFYDEVVSSCQVVHPEIIERYYRETEKRNMPSSEKEFREYQNLKIRSDFPWPCGWPWTLWSTPAITGWRYGTTPTSVIIPGPVEFH